MATGDKKINIFVKRLLSKTGIRDQLLDFLDNKIDEVVSGMFQGTSGVLDKDTIGLTADGNDKIKLDLTNADKVVVGTGEIVTIPDEAGVSKQVPIENANGVTYYVGIKYVSIESEADVNPRTGTPEYLSYEESLGEVDYPDLITDDPGVKIRVRINSITESGVDHSGRTVRVWLVNPKSGVDATAFVTGTSAYSSPNNYVDIPYSGTTYPFGQSTLSTTPSDYRVSIKGLTWRRNTDLRTDSDYAFIGTIDGAGAGNPPTNPVITDQVSVFITSLDRAYDGPTGSGSGRDIYADSLAVRLRQVSSAGRSEDVANSPLLVDKIDQGAAFAGEVYLDLKGDDNLANAALQHRENVGVAAANVDPSEPCSITNTAGNVQFTGTTLTHADFTNDLGIGGNNDMALVEILGSSQGNNGVYRFAVVDATNVTIKELDGSAVTSVVEGSLTARFFRVTALLTSKEADVGCQIATIPGRKHGVRVLRHVSNSGDYPYSMANNNAPGTLKFYVDEDGNIYSAADILAATDFKYSASRTSVEKPIPISLGASDDAKWEHNGGGSDKSNMVYWTSVATSSGITFPIILPAGSTLNSVKVDIHASNANEVLINFKKWKRGDTTMTNLRSTDYTVTSATRDVVTVDPDSPETIDNQYEYAIWIKSSSTSAGDLIYHIDVNFDYQVVTHN